MSIQNKILVTGGAGYIGSFAVRRLCELGHPVVVIDNLSKGFRAAVDKRAKFFQTDIGDVGAVTEILKTEKPTSVLHFAAFIEVGESVKNPQKFLENNFEKARTFADTAVQNGVDRFILSSTAAVYGEPSTDLIEESHLRKPVNAYGESKALLEDALSLLNTRNDLGIAFLRYFNVAGASPDGELGEAHEPETHLIPNLIRAALGQGPALKVFGTDYATRDGSCVRDYVHVIDLIEAHILMLQKLEAGQKYIYNLGSENGFSVLEVIAAAEKALNKKVNFERAPRRAGDPGILVAASTKARKELGWKPQYTQMSDIIAHAYAWHSKHPNGYH